MNKRLTRTWKRYRKLKEKNTALEKFFHAFLPEAVFRTTKIEHPEITRKHIRSAFQ